MQITGWLTMLLLTFALAGCNQVADSKTSGPKAAGPSGAGGPETSQPSQTPAVSQVAAKGGEAAGKSDTKTEKEDKPAKPELATMIIAGGCFWCVEAVFEELEGVVEAINVYAGGTKETAHYELVSKGLTDHAEAVQIIYDPAKITYERLLAVHFATHDPTTLNRQGADVGRHYRSAIFFADEEQKKQAQGMIDRLTEAKAFKNPIVTTLEPLTEFYVAEKYHQNYACDNPLNPYIRNVAMPKVEKVREKFKEDLKKKE